MKAPTKHIEPAGVVYIGGERKHRYRCGICELISDAVTPGYTPRLWTRTEKCFLCPGCARDHPEKASGG